MPLYEQLENLDDGYFLEECKARASIGKWFIVFLFMVVLILAPLKFGVLTILMGMAGSGLAFELDESKAKPDAFERLQRENQKLKEDLRGLKAKRVQRFKRTFGKK